MKGDEMEREIAAIVAAHPRLEVFYRDIEEWKRRYRIDLSRIDDILSFTESFIDSVFDGRVKTRKGKVVSRATKRVFHVLRRCLDALDQEEDTLEILIELVIDKESTAARHKRGELKPGALTWRLHMLVEAVEAWRSAPEYVHYEAAERAVDAFCSGTREIRRRKI